MIETCFVDALQHQMRTRIEYLLEIMEYIETLDQPDDIHHPSNAIANLFLQIHILLNSNT